MCGVSCSVERGLGDPGGADLRGTVPLTSVGCGLCYGNFHRVQQCVDKQSERGNWLLANPAGPFFGKAL